MGVRIGAVFVMAIMTLASRAAAQTDAGVFRIYQGAMELGREVFQDDGTTLRSNITIPLLNTRIVQEATRAGGRVVRTEIRAYALPADTLLRTYSAVVSGDSVQLALVPVTGEARHWSKPGRPDEISSEQSVAAIVSLMQRSGKRDTSWTFWLPSADSLLELRLDFSGDSIEAGLASQQLFAMLGADGRVQLLEVPASRVRFVRHNSADSLPPLAGMSRPEPDYRAPPGAAYAAEQVRVPVRPSEGDTFSLGCTLTRPLRGGPRFPAAITLTGSGAQDRDENLWPLVPDYHLFRDVAVRLAATGIAVLRCDDRGFGASGGPLERATMVDFASDARAQLEWLRGRPDVDPERLAVIGHSEGGIVGPMVALDDRRLAALVIMAGTGKDMAAVVRDQFLYPVERAANLTPEQRDAARAEALRQAEEFVNRPMPYLRHARDYDPLITARLVRQPVLIVHGALDRQVTAGQADTLGAAIREGGNRAVTVRVFPGLNHLFLVSPSGTGATDEYAVLRDVTPPAEVLETLASWLAARLRAR